MCSARLLSGRHRLRAMSGLEVRRESLISRRPTSRDRAFGQRHPEVEGPVVPGEVGKPAMARWPMMPRSVPLRCTSAAKRDRLEEPQIRRKPPFLARVGGGGSQARTRLRSSSLIIRENTGKTSPKRAFARPITVAIPCDTSIFLAQFPTHRNREHFRRIRELNLRNGEHQGR
jgi:hypothetical protein